MRLIVGFILIIMLLIAIASCNTTRPIVDNDDMYGGTRDTLVVKRVRKNPRPNYTYYTPNYGWYGWGYSYGYPYQYYRPNVIIVTPNPEPQFKYEKRPDREGNGGVGVPIGRRRGRD